MPYGSQMTLTSAGRFKLLPVQDEPHLDERRAQVGLGSIADYLAEIEKDCRKPAAAE